MSANRHGTGVLFRGIFKVFFVEFTYQGIAWPQTQ